MADHGIEVFTFQRTMSFGNWPFLVLILLLAGAASTSLIIDGDWKGVGLVFGAVCAVPLFVGAVQFLPELFGARVLVGVFAHGIVWARLWRRGFIAWSNLESVGVGRFTERRGRAGEPISLPQLQEVGAALAFISERLPKP